MASTLSTYILCIQQSLRFADLATRLNDLHLARSQIFQALHVSEVIAMSEHNPSTSTPARPQKLQVIRFLQTHLEEGAIDQRSHDILRRMVMSISAIGRELHVMIQSKITVWSVLMKLEHCSTCILEGCALFRSRIAAPLKRHQETGRQADERTAETRRRPQAIAS